MHVANLSLSSKAEAMYAPLHEVADAAYFSGTVLVCAANNLPGPTYPSQYSSVVSVAARPGAEDLALAYNAHPPVEFGARGIDVDVAWIEPRVDHGHRQQLRRTARDRDGGPDAQQAPVADAVPGQGRAACRERQQRPGMIGDSACVG